MKIPYKTTDKLDKIKLVSKSSPPLWVIVAGGLLILIGFFYFNKH
jgi:hypothetical protein